MALDLDALKAEFAARGGKATVVAQGIRAIENERRIYAARIQGKRAAADAVIAGDIAYAKWETAVQEAHMRRAYGVRD